MFIGLIIGAVVGALVGIGFAVYRLRGTAGFVPGVKEVLGGGPVPQQPK